jgi:hypothetical protein
MLFGVVLYGCSLIMVIAFLLISLHATQYAGIHWSRNEEMYQKHFEEYVQCTATVFRECNIFVIWGMIVAKDYEGLTEHFVQLNPDESKHLSKPELAQLLKERLQCTTWSYN